MKLNILKFFLLSAVLINLTQCSTYTVKKDLNKKGELTKTPIWYVKFDREDKNWMYETASSVSPDLELSIKKSTLLAKAKIADRVNGKMNNQSTISKDEKGLNENIAIDASSNDLVVNSVKETLVRYYIVDKVEVFFTHSKSYRSYVRVKVSKDNVEDVVNEIKTSMNNKTLKENNKTLAKKAKDILNKFD